MLMLSEFVKLSFGRKPFTTDSHPQKYSTLLKSLET